MANLPYNVATPLVVESLDGLPTVRHWCVMVQREVADRLFAEPRTKAYGAVSVLVRLTAERTGFHPVSPTVFRPPPNVDSALVAFRRTRDWGPEFAALKRVVQAAFGHRRKTLANSVSLAGFERARADAALETLGLDPSVRAEALPPETFLAPRRGARVTVVHAYAKINLTLVVGPRRADGLHEIATVMQQIDLADRLELEPAPQLDVEGFEDTLVSRRARRCSRRWRSRATRGMCGSTRGSRSPPGSAAGAPTPLRRS